LAERQIGYTVGFYARTNVAAASAAVPADAWVPVLNQLQAIPAPD
jgi:hypothetical protein